MGHQPELADFSSSQRETVMMETGSSYWSLEPRKQQAFIEFQGWAKVW
jgi:hypothetical protein